MSVRKGSFVTVAVLVQCVALLGCGGGGGDQPELGLVSGTVTLDGKPLAGACITFQPDDGRPATGRTDGAGKYEMIYIRDTRGCKIGHNRVTITTLDEEGDDPGAEGDDGRQVVSEAVKEELPAKYNSNTELDADVKAGENTIDFKLQS